MSKATEACILHSGALLTCGKQPELCRHSKLRQGPVSINRITMLDLAWPLAMTVTLTLRLLHAATRS